jgi:gluconate 2-dehydrogenase gamma chain
MTEKDNEKDSLSRRKFIKNTGMVAGGVVGGSLLGGLFTNQFQSKPETSTKENELQHLHDARMFFSRKDDFDILSAATERIFPKDDHGPGAIELGVPYFIDKQLAGAWGTNAKAYMKDPFRQNEQTHKYQSKNRDQDKSGPNSDTQAPTPTPRYQTRLNRGDIFIHGIRKMDQVSQDKFDSKFIELDGEQQDEILTAFENGEVEMKGVASVTFFNFLIKTTLEGAFADPVYGGNKDMLGWKMKEYPGPRMGYLDDIEKEDFIKMEPKSLREYQS